MGMRMRICGDDERGGDDDDGNEVEVRGSW